MTHHALGTPTQPLAGEGEFVRYDVRSSDPANPSAGQEWLRGDLTDAGAGKIGEYRFYHGGETTAVAIYALSELESWESDARRVQLNGETGYIPLLPIDDAQTDVKPFRHNGQTMGLGRVPIPNSEGFEHNNLTGNYGGDTGEFSIQTGTVDEGTYALSVGGGATNYIITRSTGSPWDRSGIRVRWRQYTPSSAGAGGISFNTSVTGYASSNGYNLYHEPPSDTFEIRRADDGSQTILDSVSESVTADAWVDASVEFAENGTITYTMDGNTTASATDTNYTQLLLAFHAYRSVYFDDVRFDRI